METQKTLAVVKEILDKPLPKEAVQPHPTKTYLSTIKAIYVVERFNEAFGLGGWYITNEVVEAKEKMVVVKSNFYAPKYKIRVVDIFGGNDNPDRGDAYKGACTDALTKIGSYLGVGMNVYKGLKDETAVKTNVVSKATPEQRAEIDRLASEVEMTGADLVKRCKEVYGVSLVDLNSTQAEGIIAGLKKRLAEKK